MIAASETRYTRVAILLHWLIAAGIVANLFIGLCLDTLFASSRGVAIGVHASIGLTVLALVVLRVIWRVINLPPPFGPELGRLEQIGARGAHLLLYVLMVAMPLSGWAILSSNPPVGSEGAAALAALGEHAHPNDSIKIWSSIEVPVITPLWELGATAGGAPAQLKLHGHLENLHSLGGWLLILTAVLHVAAALKHQFVDKTNILARMAWLPKLRLRKE